MNRWNSLSQMIEHSMKHVLAHLSIYRIWTSIRLKMDLFNLNELKCPLITKKVYRNRRKYTFGNNFEKENIDFKFHL